MFSVKVGMAVYRPNNTVYQVSRESVFVDTNILVGAFCPRDIFHEDSRIFLNEFSCQWLLPVAVIVEAFGVIVSRTRSFYEAYTMLSWANTPGNAIVIDCTKGRMNEETEVMNRFQVDCVDAILMLLATDISRSCGFGVQLPVATYDAKDFLKGISDERMYYDIYDMRTGDRYLRPEIELN